MLDWISLDDVLYRWDGQDIVCETGVGYSAKMEGNHLDGLDIIDFKEEIVSKSEIHMEKVPFSNFFIN